MSSNPPVLGGFADSFPEPLASNRHLRRLIYIVIGIAAAMFLQARRSAPTAISPSRIPLYLGLIAIELVFVWFVAIGIHGHGHTLKDLLGCRWRRPVDGLLDILLAVATAALLRVLGPFLYEMLGRWPSNTGFLLPTTWRNRSSG
ncbi:MAG TPA: hypothetical protein VLO30_03940 [Chthoniobacterales bacterium]|nr:hypothetical protein [Chthoniobacterales bacterium]